MQNGHYIKRGNHAVRWDEDNCRPQCRDCNEGHNGRFDIFEEELKEELGDKGFEMLLWRSRQPYPGNDVIQEKLTYYTKAVEKMGKTQ